jgi:hypothetical protein
MSLLATLLVSHASSVAALDVSVTLDRGPDVGQNFGSLFEAQSADGAYVIGAGFLGVYNTYNRVDRHTVHFFVRPTTEARTHDLERLPRPSDLAGTYLFDEAGELYAAQSEPRRWDTIAKQWTDADADRSGSMRLGNDMLTFSGQGVAFNDAPILPPPEKGNYYRFYYALGHLFFYHTVQAGGEGYRLHTEDTTGFTKIYACPWRPGDGAINLNNAIVLTAPVIGENPFAYGQLGKDVLTCSNIGGLYAFDGTAWRTLVDGELKTSYQIYTMLNYHDRLLMGQYPTGELFSFDGQKVTHLAGWPPRMPGVRGSSREAQTTTIYGGNLYVGVWPWGEVWRYQPDTQQWRFVDRMFTHPEPTDETTHPYEKETAAVGDVMNQWGQRVTSMIPMGESLMVSTSAKWPCEWEPKFAFLDDTTRKEYGALLRLNAPGHLSAPVRWTDGPTTLRFVLTDSEMRVEQDGVALASRSLGELKLDGLVLAEPTWGAGIYGPYQGKSLSGERLATRER